MGASYSLVDDPEFTTLKNNVNTINSTIADYPKLKTDVANVGRAAAGSINMDDIAKALSDSNVYSSRISDAISNSPGKLGDALNEKMSSNQVFIDKIGRLLVDNTTFSNTISKTLTDPSQPFKAKITGPKGDSGELSSSKAAVKDNLYNKNYTVWCADGDVCQLPVGSKGFTSGEDIILSPKSKVVVDTGVLKLGDTHLSGNKDEWIRLLSNPDDTGSYNKGLAADRLWSKGESWIGGQLNATNKIAVGGGSMVIDGGTINNTGRMHISGGESLYLLNKNGVIVGKEWGGNGNLAVQGNAGVGGKLDVGGDAQFNGIWARNNLVVDGGAVKIGNWYLQDIGGDLRIHKGNPNDSWFTFGGNGWIYTKGKGGQAIG